VDQKPGVVVTKLPDGSELRLRIRDVDLRNVKILQDMRGITVLQSIKEVEDTITGIV